MQINAKNKYGFSALILAAGMGNFDIVKLLNELMIVDVNVVESNSCSALMIACMHGYTHVAEELLDRSDCDVNIGQSAHSPQPTPRTYMMFSAQCRTLATRVW